MFFITSFVHSDEEQLLGEKTPEVSRKKSKDNNLNNKKETKPPSRPRSGSLVEKSTGPSVLSTSEKSLRKSSKSKDHDSSNSKKNKKSKNKDNPDGSSGSKKPKKSKNKNKTTNNNNNETYSKLGSGKQSKSKSGSVNKLQKFSNPLFFFFS